MSEIDSELQRRFGELRENDEATAPSFAALRHRAVAMRSSRGVRPQRRWIVPAALAAAAVVVATVWITIRSRGEQARQEAWLRDSSTNVMRWTMPTDGLLRSARRTLQIPALSASVLDGAAVPIPGTPYKGN